MTWYISVLNKITLSCTSTYVICFTVLLSTSYLSWTKSRRGREEKREHFVFSTSSCMKILSTICLLVCFTISLLLFNFITCPALFVLFLFFFFCLPRPRSKNIPWEGKKKSRGKGEEIIACCEILLWDRHVDLFAAGSISPELPLFRWKTSSLSILEIFFVFGDIVCAFLRTLVSFWDSVLRWIY